jgi:SAM-dependent methyltransferase
LRDLLSRARSVYRAAIPARVRDPIGLARRYFVDDLRRLVASPPLPPRRLLRQIQLTPFLEEYLRIGGAAAASITQVLRRHDLPRGARLLDFGCGSGRVLRHLVGEWELYGCDTDAEAIAWSQRHLPARFSTNAALPPLPFESEFFAGVFSVSVFTHLPMELQRAWAAELGRILVRDGLCVVSVLGPELLDNYPDLGIPEHRARLAADGFLYIDGGTHFSNKTAVHTQDAITRIFTPEFEIIEYLPGGLDGFQSLVVLRRR